MTEKMREKPEKEKGKQTKKPLSQVLKNMKAGVIGIAGAGMIDTIMGRPKESSLFEMFKGMGEQKDEVSVPQKLVEAGALVKTEEWVTDVEVSNLLENDSKGKFELVRDREHGNPKVVATTQTEAGDKVEFILEIPKYPTGERKISEILDEIGAVPERIVEKVQLIERSGEVALRVMDPNVVEDTIEILLDRDVPISREMNISLVSSYVSDSYYMPERERTLGIRYNDTYSTYLENVLKDPNYMSDPADLIKDDVY